MNKTTQSSVSAVSRRGFLQTSAVASGGLMIGVALPGTVFEAQAAGLMHTPMPGSTLPTTTPSR